jgi:hypothetical protein
MTRSVRIRVEDKERLDRLQRDLQAIRGRRISQQELLSWLVALAEGVKHRLGDDPDRLMTEQEISVLMRLPVRTGIRTREEDIDDDLARAAR